MSKIFIDPGHGGSDSGAVNSTYKEKDINLQVSQKLKALLIAAGFDVHLSRESDIDVGLTERCNIANNWGADIFISVHHNAGGGDGFEVYYSVSGSGTTIANLIAAEFQTTNNKRYVGVRESEKYPGHDYYTVIGSSNMPALITEYCFMDTADFGAFNADAEAQELYNAICKYYNVEGEKKAMITDANEAIKVLKEKGVITTPDYWTSAYQVVNNLGQLLINMANKLA
jgi:N-acetylmuramoyl-L-alanine amidase